MAGIIDLPIYDVQNPGTNFAGPLNMYKPPNKSQTELMNYYQN